MVDQVTQLKIKLDTETSSLRLQVGGGGEDKKEGRMRRRKEEEGRRRGREEEVVGDTFAEICTF